MIRVIWNPASGRGRGARVHPRMRAAFAAEGITDFEATTRAGDEARLVQQAIADGVTTIVAAGGDGTWSKCAVALAKATAPAAATGDTESSSAPSVSSVPGSRARLAFVAAGTGNDFAKNFRAPAGDYAAMARLIASGAGVERRVDLGCVDAGGERRWFTNVAGFGFDVAVLQATAQVPLLRGPALYVATALRELFAFRGFDVHVTSPPAVASSVGARALMLVVANGREFGGAFKIAPRARVDDGRLDIVHFADDIRLGRVPLLLRALAGRHLGHPAVRHAQADALHFSCPEAPWLELDGELHRAESAQVTVRCVPAALRVLDAPV